MSDRDATEAADTPVSEGLDSSITFNDGGSSLLTIRNSGEIQWNSPRGVVEVTDKKLFTIALMDVVVKLTNNEYDYSKLDPELYNEYREWLDTRVAPPPVPQSEPQP